MKLGQIFETNKLYAGNGICEKNNEFKSWCKLEVVDIQDTFIGFKIIDSLNKNAIGCYGGIDKKEIEKAIKV